MCAFQHCHIPIRIAGSSCCQSTPKVLHIDKQSIDEEAERVRDEIVTMERHSELLLYLHCNTGSCSLAALPVKTQ